MNTKQIVVVVVAVVLVGVLLVQPIKGLVDKTDATSTEASASEMGASPYTSQVISDMSKQSINAALAQQIADLEKEVGQAEEGEAKLELLQQLANKWDDIAKPIPQGYIYEEMAQQNPTVTYWLKAGDAYRKGYTNLQDTALASALTTKAIHAYESAIELDPSNLSAKTGLGASLVVGGGNPMTGISLLQEVVKEDPKNLEANRALGLFSLQSQQFDKAVERFITVVEQKPDAESYFYLATGYEKIGLRNEAISAYQKSKELAADPTLSQYIDRQIAELSKSN
jgi:tetratricopeptide (TPR) repeat protein